MEAHNCEMKRDIVEFMSRCLNCQQVKYEHQKPAGVIQRMPIPELIKSAHFILVRTTYTSEKLVKINIREIVRLHEVPILITSYLGTQFTLISGGLCRSCWFDDFAVGTWGSDLFRDSLDKVKLIQERLLMAQSKQKSYADRKVRELEFMVGERVLLKVSAMKGVMRFEKKDKLSLRFIGPLDIVQRIGEVPYELDLPHVLLDQNLAFEEERVAILNRQVRKLRSTKIALVKVQCFKRVSGVGLKFERHQKNVVPDVWFPPTRSRRRSFIREEEGSRGITIAG
ncbi:uncharacterized protein LOC132637050 [Lycium barbarum]|uniref:uncharacterized protein LOC132637050 n=1 Tax=Lycium barbarum TaxID=112863 RepID=UPI00293E81BF|nr:uncharacterized protein LOC132637050 [Lycium barbarum]